MGSKIVPSFQYEDCCEAGPLVAGIDEAGRGPWAGPVVAAAVILNRDKVPVGLNDSKRLSQAVRERLFGQLQSTAIVGVAVASVERIDGDNILNATLWAMARALESLPFRPDFALVDGNRAPNLACPSATLVQGDAKSISIAAASIIAKVTRDRLMVQLGERYPGYGFERHKGYGTAQHQEALLRLGALPCHRRSFKPIRDLNCGRSREARYV